MKKFSFGIIISLLFLFLLKSKFDKNEFIKVWQTANLYYLVPAVLAYFAAFFSFATRWFILLNRQLNYKHSISASMIGNGANMVLPARGGDIFRMYYCKSEAEVPYFQLFSRLFIEKVMDFIYVILIGVVAFTILFYQNQSNASYAIFTISGLIVLGMFISLYLLRFQNKRLNQFLSFLARKTRLIDFYQKHIESHLAEMESFLRFKTLFMPLVLTMVFWLWNSMVFYLLGFAIGMDLSYTHIVFILFMGAISLAIPSAPSGVGVFHASVISAFMILGMSDKEGLVFATLIHFFNFLVATLSGLIFYLFWLYKRRNGKPIDFKEMDDIKL